MSEDQSAAMPVLNDKDCYGFERKSAGIFPFIARGPMHYLPATGYCSCWVRLWVSRC